MNARALLVVMIPALVGACSSDSYRAGTPVPMQRVSDAQPLSYYSGLAMPQRLVVRDPGTWASVWGQVWKLQSPVPALPAVDFSREMVVVAALGQRPTGGYSILLDSATMTMQGLTVSVRLVSPGMNCSVTTALTQPVDVSRLPRTDEAVEFVERAETQTCP